MTAIFRNLLLTCLAVPILAAGQTSDEQRAQAFAVERQRLGNERIRLESEVRAREEEERRRLEAEEQERLRVQQEEIANQATSVPDSASNTSRASTAPDMSRTLEQLRTLGELKDAGYVTEAEFERIKKKILDNEL